MKLSYFISESSNPYRNLATEEYLCTGINEDEGVLYLWKNAPTVVIGRYQNAFTECACDKAESDGVYIARRKTGGGAVFHDQNNLNFSFIFPVNKYDKVKNFQVIIEALGTFGLACELSGRNDMTIDGAKFSGNAFFSGGKFALHHGTLMLNVDISKMADYLTPPQAKLAKRGLGSVKSRVVNLESLSPVLTEESLKKELIKAFSACFGGVAAEISIDEEAIAALEKEYAARDFVFGEHPEIVYSFATESAVYALANIGGTKRLLTDSLDVDLIATLNAALEGGALKPTVGQDDVEKMTVINKLKKFLEEG